MQCASPHSGRVEFGRIVNVIRRGLRGRSRLIKVATVSCNYEQESRACRKKSFQSNIRIASGACTCAVAASKAYAQSSPASPSGFSFDQAKNALEPVSNFLASLLSIVSQVWGYLMDHPPAIVLLSTLIASYVAIRSIASQREMTRLRETFVTLDKSIRDKDIIDTNIEFKNIRNDLKNTKESIAKYHNPLNEGDVKKATTLGTLMKDYENLAIGVRYQIIDEAYLHRWMRSAVIHDWNALSPLVTAYRSTGAANAYIEFEGLATSWQRDLSFRTGKKLKKANRFVSVR